MIDKSKLHELERLGLTEKESLVYTSLLSLGKVGTSKVIQDTGLHGQFVYQSLASLEEKGLVGHVIIRGRKKFHAKHPRALIHIAEQRARAAQTIVRDLESALALPPEQAFETYQGVESFIAHEEELLQRAPKGCEILVIGGEGDRFLETMGTSLGAYEAIRRKKEVSIRYLGSLRQKEALQKDRGGRFLFRHHVLPGLFTGLVNTNVWPDALNLNIFAQPVTSFQINSREAADSYRGFFETLWNMGKE